LYSKQRQSYWTYLKLNEISSIEDPIVANAIFSKKYSYYDKDKDQSMGCLESEATTKKYTELDHSNVYSEGIFLSE